MQQEQRLVWLDWLRILAILGVLFFHSAMPFASELDWHIRNKETSNLFLEFNFFLSRFRMPLLFFISGAVAFFMLKKRNSSQFITLRFKRLFIPLLFGTLFIVPLQVYMERVEQGFSGNFFEFYPTFFTTGIYPTGNFSWHHLWFLAYLFVYNVTLAPLLRYVVVNRSKLAIFNLFSVNKRIYLLQIPSIICFSALVLSFPETHALVNDWCWFIYWLFFMLIGFLSMGAPALIQSIERNRRTSLAFTFLLILMLNYLRWNELEPFQIIKDWKTDPRTYLYLSLYPLTAWMWVFAIVGYGRKYLNKTTSYFSYLNNAAYPFYILHQTVIVVIAYYVMKTSDTIFMKYAFVVLVSLAITMAVYHLFIKPYAVVRFLFGSEKKRETRKLQQDPEININHAISNERVLKY
jgi:glucans biosynthesis protein C